MANEPFYEEQTLRDPIFYGGDIPDIASQTFRDMESDPKIARRIQFNGANPRFAFQTVNPATRAFTPPWVAQKWFQQQEVVNTTTETDLINSAVFPAADTINGNLLDLAGGWLVCMGGDYLNNSGAVRTLQIKVKLGATTLFDDTTGNIGASASRRAWWLWLVFGSAGATNAQKVFGHFYLGAPNSATTGTGGFYDNAATTIFECPIYGESAEDSTADLEPQFTVIHSTNNANLSIRRQWGFAEYLS